MNQISPEILEPPPADEIARLVARWRRANGPVISLLNRFSGQIESRLAVMPASLRRAIEAATEQALQSAYGLASHVGRGETVSTGRLRGARSLAVAMLAGAAGGSGGIATAVAELPVTVTLILHAIQEEARAAGFDTDDPWIRAEALRTLASGSPMAADDGVDTSFLSARLALSGPALQRLIATVAPKFATALSQKLAAQAVPVLGAVSGAALNAAFLRYYREMAAIRFALLRLAERHGNDPVLEAFRRAAERPRLRKGEPELP